MISISMSMVVQCQRRWLPWPRSWDRIPRSTNPNSHWLLYFSCIFSLSLRTRLSSIIEQQLQERTTLRVNFPFFVTVKNSKKLEDDRTRNLILERIQSWRRDRKDQKKREDSERRSGREELKRMEREERDRRERGIAREEAEKQEWGREESEERDRRKHWREDVRDDYSHEISVKQSLKGISNPY